MALWGGAEGSDTPPPALTRCFLSTVTAFSCSAAQETQGMGRGSRGGEGRGLLWSHSLTAIGRCLKAAGPIPDRVHLWVWFFFCSTQSLGAAGEKNVRAAAGPSACPLAPLIACARAISCCLLCRAGCKALLTRNCPVLTLVIVTGEQLGHARPSKEAGAITAILLKLAAHALYIATLNIFSSPSLNDFPQVSTVHLVGRSHSQL